MQGHPTEVQAVEAPCLPNPSVSRGAQRYIPTARADEDQLTKAVVTLASQYGRYGYRRITALLRTAAWRVGKDRVQRIWRREGLKVPQKQRPRGRLWLNDGSCIRLRPARPRHVWSYDFVAAQTHDGRPVRLLTLLDEFTRECLAIRVARRINSFGVIEVFADAMLRHGVPVHIRSHNGPEMTAKVVRDWLSKIGSKTLSSSRAARGRTGTNRNRALTQALQPGTSILRARLSPARTPNVRRNSTSRTGNGNAVVSQSDWTRISVRPAARERPTADWSDRVNTIEADLADLRQRLKRIEEKRASFPSGSRVTEWIYHLQREISFLESLLEVRARPRLNYKS